MNVRHKLLGGETMTVIEEKMLTEVLKAGIEITFQIVKSSILCSVKIYHGREKRIEKTSKGYSSLRIRV